MKLWIQCAYLYFPGCNIACVWKVYSSLSPHPNARGNYQPEVAPSTSRTFSQRYRGTLDESTDNVSNLWPVILPIQDLVFYTDPNFILTFSQKFTPQIIQYLPSSPVLFNFLLTYSSCYFLVFLLWASLSVGLCLINTEFSISCLILSSWSGITED